MAVIFVLALTFVVLAIIAYGWITEPAIDKNCGIQAYHTTHIWVTTEGIRYRCNGL